MKKMLSFFILGLMIFQVQAQDFGMSSMDDEAVPFTPEQESEFFSQPDNSDFMERAGMGSWNEASASSRTSIKGFTGNYKGYAPRPGAAMAEILKQYLGNYMKDCIKESLVVAGRKDVAQTLGHVHILHNGIMGDGRHQKTKSLHNVGRAIDLVEFKMSYKKGTSSAQVIYNYNKDGRGVFFNELRSCWGRVVAVENDCPYFEGEQWLTGSIGKENKNHQHHLHLSVPVCKGGSYVNGYYKR